MKVQKANKTKYKLKVLNLKITLENMMNNKVDGNEKNI